MLDDTSLRLMRLHGEGYCCSQIMLIMALEDLGRDNPDLVRAMAGLCKGGGDCSGPCGVLTGGACLLAMHAAKGHADESADDKLPLLLDEYANWFRDEACAPFGGTACADVVGDCPGAPHPERCGSLVAQGFVKALDILAANGFDPMEGR